MVYFFSFIAFSCFLLSFMFINGKRNRLNNQTLHFEHFPEGLPALKIFFISDIHRRKISERLLQQVQGSIDLVIIGGDLTESGVPFERVQHNLNLLKRLAPVYFVSGNNDYEVDQVKLGAMFTQLGVNVLSNSSAVIKSHGDNQIVLLGVEDLTKNKDRLDLALDHCTSSNEAFKILVSHNPDIYKKVRRADKISLILSGHTHGGQIRIFGLGLHSRGKIHYLDLATLLISNGYGTSTVPLRLGAPAEAHYIIVKGR